MITKDGIELGDGEHTLYNGILYTEAITIQQHDIVVSGHEWSYKKHPGHKYRCGVGSLYSDLGVLRDAMVYEIDTWLDYARSGWMQSLDTQIKNLEQL